MLSAICHASEHDGEVSLLVPCCLDKNSLHTDGIDRSVARKVKCHLCFVYVANYPCILCGRFDRSIDSLETNGKSAIQVITVLPVPGKFDSRLLSSQFFLPHAFDTNLTIKTNTLEACFYILRKIIVFVKTTRKQTFISNKLISCAVNNTQFY